VRTRSFIFVAAFLAVLVVLGGALYAYDHARADEIAPGVKIGGVPLGGLTPEQARGRLEREILQRLEQPIVIHHAAKTWKLGPREARLRADLGAMVDEALARSRTGNIFARSWRSLTGKRINDDLQPTVQYSDAAVIRLIDKVRKSVERPAKDASVKINAAGVRTIPGVEGLAISASQLHRQIGNAITSTTASRTFVAKTRHTQPKVTTADLKRKYDTVIIVNRSEFRLRLFKELKPAQTYGIAVGQVGLETPAGQYTIANKAINPAWHVPNSPWAGTLAGTVIPGDDPTNPIKARWMGIYAGVGIHGTSDDASIGHNASHGCIRMHIPDVERLYDEVPVGSAVYIA
jgi:lipoprotein-anchoring transpeptidase ErfK/SrfK